MLAMPNKLAEGGVPAPSIILHYAFDWSVGVTNFILTAAIMLIGYRYLPRRTTGLTLLTAPLISLFIYLTENRMDALGDPLVSAIFAGFFIGIGAGLILRTGSSMGGSTIIAQMFHHNLGWDLTRTNLVIDIAIVASRLPTLHRDYSLSAHTTPCTPLFLCLSEKNQPISFSKGLIHEKQSVSSPATLSRLRMKSSPK